MQSPNPEPRIKLGTVELGGVRFLGADVPQANKGFSTEADSTRDRRHVGKREMDLSSVRPATWVALAITLLGVPVLLFNLFRNSPSGPIPIDVEAEAVKYENYVGVARGSSTDIRIELQSIKILENTGRQREAQEELQKLLLASSGNRSNPLYQLATEHLAAGSREMMP